MANYSSFLDNPARSICAVCGKIVLQSQQNPQKWFHIGEKDDNFDHEAVPSAKRKQQRLRQYYRMKP